MTHILSLHGNIGQNAFKNTDLQNILVKALSHRPGGDSSLRNVSWRLAGSPGSREKFKHVRFFIFYFFWDFFQSPAGLGDVSATSPSVAATSRRLILSATAASDQSRQLGRLGRPKNGLRSHQGDVATTDDQPWRRLLGESASHFSVSWVAQVAATDQLRQSRRHLRQWDRPFSVGDGPCKSTKRSSFPFGFK